MRSGLVKEKIQLEGGLSGFTIAKLVHKGSLHILNGGNALISFPFASGIGKFRIFSNKWYE